MSTIVPRSCPPRLASAAARILFLAVILTLMTPLSFSSAASAAKRRSDADILPPLTSPLDFTLTAHGSGEGPTVLIVGGIQGDEPGGFSAAALLATHYRYDGGTVLVIPNLNFPSIIKRSRGLHGDMNRKFAALRESDPEYATVRRLQSIITRHIHPVDAALITVGSFHSGTAGNIIPDETVFSGIIRVLDMQLRDSIKSQLRELCENIARAYGASCVVDYQDSYPTLINNQELLDSVSEICREKLGDKNILLNPKSSLGADDFAYFCHAAKGLYFNLGCHTPGTPEEALHSAILNPDENCIRIGILSEVLAVLKIMGVEIE